MQTQRFSPSPRGNNPSYKKTVSSEKIVTARKLKSLVLPVLHSRPAGKVRGYGVVDLRVQNTCGADAAAIMAMISDQAPTFQMNRAAIAERCGMSLERTRRAINALVQAKYAHWLPWRKGGKNFGQVLQTAAEGNIQPLQGSVLHYSIDEDTKEAAQRPVRRANMRWERNPSRQSGRRRKIKLEHALTAMPVLPLVDIQPGAEMTGAEDNPPAPPIMVTPLEKEKENPKTPLADAERGLLSFLEVDCSGLDSEAKIAEQVQEVTAKLNTEAEKVLNPLSPADEVKVAGWVEQSMRKQLEAGESTAVFDQEVLRAMREAQGTWGCVEADAIPEILQAVELLSPRHRPHQQVTTENLIARAMLAPRFCSHWNSLKGRTYVPFHEGWQVFDAFIPASAKVFGDVADPQLGLEHIPSSMLRGDGSLLWLHTHTAGLVLLSCLKNPGDLTAGQACRIVRRLKKGTLTQEDIYRFWLLTHYGTGKLTVEAAVERLSWKQSLQLKTEEQLCSYNTALQRMQQENREVCPDKAGTDFDFTKEGSTENFGVLSYADMLYTGRNILLDWQADGDVRDLLQAHKVDGWNPGRLTQDEEYKTVLSMLLAAFADGRQDIMSALENWGAYKQLQYWLMNCSAGRALMLALGDTWDGGDLNAFVTLFGWQSFAEWTLLAELRRFAMRQSWFAFKNSAGQQDHIWNRIFLR